MKRLHYLLMQCMVLCASNTFSNSGPNQNRRKEIKPVGRLKWTFRSLEKKYFFQDNFESLFIYPFSLFGCGSNQIKAEFNSSCKNCLYLIPT